MRYLLGVNQEGFGADNALETPSMSAVSLETDSSGFPCSFPIKNMRFSVCILTDRLERRRPVCVSPYLSSKLPAFCLMLASRQRNTYLLTLKHIGGAI